MVRSVLTALLFLTTVLPITPSLAEDAPPITSYAALFDATVSGVKMGEIKRSLKKHDNGLFEQTSLIYTTGLLSVFRSDRFEEHSFWRWQNNAPVPERYTYHFSSSSKGDIVEQLDFDWQKQQVKSLQNDNTVTLEIEKGTVDKLSYQIALVRDLRQGKREFAYRIADRGDIRTINYKVVGEEEIETPWGKQHTVKVQRVTLTNERVTILWFAPDLDYMVIKLLQDDNGTKMSATIKELVIEGMKLVKRPEKETFTWPND